MARYTPIKNSFVAGELSPRLDGRDDLDQYFQGMKLCENFIVLPHGGVMRRSGSRFVATTKNQSKKTRLIDFQVSTDQAYVCEFGDTYIRFYANEGQIESSPGVPAEVVSPYTEDDIADIHYQQDQDVMFLVHEDYPPYKLSRTGPTTFSLALVSFRDGHAPMRPDNRATSTTLTVSSATEPRTLTWSADIGLTTLDDVGRIVRFKTNEWYQITSVTSGSVAIATSFSGTTPTIGAPSSNWALGMFSDTEGARSVVFHEGRLGYLGSRVIVNWYALSKSDDFDNFMTGSNADDAILKRLVAGKVNALQWGASADEALIIGTLGTEFRLVAQGDNILTPTSTKSKPSTSRGSEHVQPLSIDSEVLFIQRSGKKLRNLTYDLEKDGRIARDVAILSEHILLPGVSELHYQQSPDSVVWCKLNNGNLAGFTYEREQKVNGAHRHILGGSFGSGAAEVESMCVIPTPDGKSDQVWLCVKRTIDGVTKRYIEFFMQPFRPGLALAAPAAARSAAMEVTPFSDCSLTLDAPVSISAISIANPAVFTANAHGFNNGDTVKLRYIDSFNNDMADLNAKSYTVANKTANTFELIGPDNNLVSTVGMGAYIDSGKVYKETTVITGLSHLEGETVAIQADGRAHPSKVVSSGQIVLDYPASIVHIGLQFISRGETMRFVGGGRTGTDQGKPQRIQRIIARLLETVGGEWRQSHNDELELEYIPPDTDGDATDTAVPFFTGDYEISPRGGWDQEPTVYFEQSEPLPMTVLALMIWGDSRER